MMTMRPRFWIPTFLTTFFLASTWMSSAACAPKTTDQGRCTQCGMRIRIHSRWLASAVDAKGKTHHFDSPKCLWRWMSSREGRSASHAWVTEYYTQQKHNARDVFYIVGSDVIGPMGHDLVPIAGREAADRFARDHRGRRVISAREISPALLRSLDAE